MKTKELIKFTYVKADKSTSERTVFVVSTPSKMLFGIDLSEYVEDECVEDLAEALKEIYTRKFKEINAEIDSLDLGGNYRQFKEEGIMI